MLYKTYVISFPASQPPSFEMSATLGSAVRIMGGSQKVNKLWSIKGTACAYTDWYIIYIYIISLSTKMVVCIYNNIYIIFSIILGVYTYTIWTYIRYQLKHLETNHFHSFSMPWPYCSSYARRFARIWDSNNGSPLHDVAYVLIPWIYPTPPRSSTPPICCWSGLFSMLASLARLHHNVVLSWTLQNKLSEALSFHKDVVLSFAKSRCCWKMVWPCCGARFAKKSRQFQPWCPMPCELCSRILQKSRKNVGRRAMPCFATIEPKTECAAGSENGGPVPGWLKIRIS